MSKKSFRIMGVIMILAGILAAPVLGTELSTVQAASSTLNPTADAYVDSSMPTVNFGGLTALRVDGSPFVRSYLSFDLSRVSGTITQADLRVYATTASTSGVSVWGVNNTAWTETGITYDNAPAAGRTVATSAAVTAGSWLEFDVTSLAAGNELVSLGLSTAGPTAISLASRESGANAPQLIITTGQPVTQTSQATAAASRTSSPTVTPNASTSTFTPSADEYVDSATPTINFGALTMLRVDSSPVMHSYARFSVSGLSGAVSQATLRLYANSTSTSGIGVYSEADNSWSETSMNYNNAPLLGSLLGTTSPVTGGTWMEMDVTSQVKGNGLVSFALDTPGVTTISLGSRESGADAPQLVVISAGGPRGTPTATQTKLPTATQTKTATVTPTKLPTATKTKTATVTPTKTAAASATPTGTLTKTPAPTSTLPSGTPVTIAAAGDLTECNGLPATMTSGAAIVSDMVLSTNYPFFTMGDDSNDTGTAADYTNCYDPTWGRLKSRTYPVIGNHDFIADPQAGPYFAYFAGQTGIYGHYSVNVGAWHIIILNSDCSIGEQYCGPGKPQETWLKADLAANTKKCIMALWHQPMFTSGREQEDVAVKTFWQDLYAAHATLILNGHNHNYERFEPMDPSGAAAADGITEIVAGTGGAGQTQTTKPMAPNEVVRNVGALGYLKLTLNSDSVDWQFMPQPGKTFTDAGSANCN